MEIKYLQAKLELKQSDDKGTFEGYAAVYGNIDNGNDIIEPHAFDEIKTTKNGDVRLAVNHDLTKFIGTAKAVSDSTGIKINGLIHTAIEYARDAYELMRIGVYDALSVGYVVKEADYEMREGVDVRVIKSAQLWEISVVPFGMNERAKIIDVKSDKRLFEASLRERMGLSQKEAKIVTKLFFSNRDGSEDNAEMVELKRAEAFLDEFLKKV